jgi:hypothetical protein
MASRRITLPKRIAEQVGRVAILWQFIEEKTGDSAFDREYGKPFTKEMPS